MSIIVERILSGAPYQSNCYVLRAGERSQQAVAIDPGGDPADVLAVLGEATLAGILVTHGDVDHIAGVAELARTTRAAVWMPAGEAGALRTGTTRGGLRVSPHLPEHELRGGESLSVGGMVFDVLSVPGHSSHHLAYLVEESIFSGDLIFTGSIGRIDLPGGDFPTLLASVVGLLERAGPQAVLYPGHGDPTTLARELETNPFLAALREG